MKEEVAKDISIGILHAYNEIAVGDYRVLTLPARHSTEEEALLYYVERGGKGYLHLCDTGALDDAAVAYLAEKGAHADLITFDCTFLDAPPREGTRHMCVEDNVRIRDRLLGAGVIGCGTKCVITHFSHNSKPTRERIAAVEEKYGVIAAYDGMTVEI